MVRMSGWAPKCSKANSLPVRPKPHMTSSHTRRMPYLSSSAREAGQPALGRRLDAVGADDGLDERSPRSMCGPSYWIDLLEVAQVIGGALGVGGAEGEVVEDRVHHADEAGRAEARWPSGAGRRSSAWRRGWPRGSCGSG